MAIGIDKSKFESLVIFNDISALYPIGVNIECRFYVNSDFMCLENHKIGLFKVGWSDKQESLVLKDINSCQTDEFGEKTIIFTSIELPKVASDQEYQFCYFYPSNNIYRFCGSSTAFRFFKFGYGGALAPTQHILNRTTTQFSTHPTLKTDKDIVQMFSKRISDMNLEELKENLTNPYINKSQTFNKPIEHHLYPNRTEFQKDRFRSLPFENMSASINSSQQNVASLENQLKIELKSEDRTHLTQNNLMDTIKLTETKNSSLDEVEHKLPIDKPKFVDVSDYDLEELKCGICFEIFFDPVVTPCCRQSYCSKCINEWLTDHNTCPNDRKQLRSIDLVPSSRVLINLLNNMRTRCDFHINGCKQIVELNHLSEHVLNCDFDPKKKCKYCGCDPSLRDKFENTSEALKLSEDKFSLLENELKLKLESDDRTQIMQNNLMDTIKLTEAQNVSLEEVVTAMRKKCSEQEEIIHELKAKFALTQNELNIYHTTESEEKIRHDTKVEEFKSKYEKVEYQIVVLLKKINELEKSKIKSEVESQMMKETIHDLKRRVDKAEQSEVKVTAELKAKDMLIKKLIDGIQPSLESS